MRSLEGLEGDPECVNAEWLSESRISNQGKDKGIWTASFSVVLSFALVIFGLGSLKGPWVEKTVKGLWRSSAEGSWQRSLINRYLRYRKRRLCQPLWNLNLSKWQCREAVRHTAATIYSSDATAISHTRPWQQRGWEYQGRHLSTARGNPDRPLWLFADYRRKPRIGGASLQAGFSGAYCKHGCCFDSTTANCQYCQFQQCWEVLRHTRVTISRPNGR